MTTENQTQETVKPVREDFSTEIQKEAKTLYAKRKNERGNYIEILFTQSEYSNALYAEFATNFDPKNYGENGATLVGAKALEAEVGNRKFMKTAFQLALKEWQKTVEEEARSLYISTIIFPLPPKREDYATREEVNAGFAAHADSMRDALMEVYTGDAKINAATAQYSGSELLAGYILTRNGVELSPIRIDWETRSIVFLVIENGIPTGKQSLAFWETLHLELRGNSYRYDWNETAFGGENDYSLTIRSTSTRMEIRLELRGGRGAQFGWASSHWDMEEAQDHLNILTDAMQRATAWQAKI